MWHLDQFLMLRYAQQRWDEICKLRPIRAFAHYETATAMSKALRISCLSSRVKDL